jgi:hypothetical protein
MKLHGSALSDFVWARFRGPHVLEVFGGDHRDRTRERVAARVLPYSPDRLAEE